MDKYIIVGGVAGGATAAARLRRLNERARIIIFEKSDYISYANCGLPYYLGGIITKRDRLLLQTPDSFWNRLRVEARVKTEVMQINPDTKTIKVKKLPSGEIYEETYDKLILSPGAVPILPPISGIDLPGIFTLRSVSDADAIYGYITRNNPQHAVIVGAGFIGLEMAESLRHRGLHVSMVEMADQVLNVIDYEMAAEVHSQLLSNNVVLHLKESVQSFSADKRGIHVTLSGGEVFSAGLVILSLGIKPNNQLALKAGLSVGAFGGIEVNEFLQTSDENIYAVGDVIEFKHPLLGVNVPCYLAGPANKQARFVADNIVRHHQRPYTGTIATAIAKVFNLTVGCTGLSEKQLKKHNVSYIASIIHTAAHAGYYPSSGSLSIKVLFLPQDGVLLGAQVVGTDGVDKRLDLLSEAIRHRGTVFDLQELDHGYAPPYSSAKDPVSIAGFVGENILRGDMPIIHWNDVSILLAEGAFLLDVRTQREFAAGHISGAYHLPVDNLRDRYNELPRDRKIVVYCAVGQRAYLAVRILMQNGFSQVFNLSGGYQTYSRVMINQLRSNQLPNHGADSVRAPWSGT